jgi:ribosome-associated translation inhibitor RaiA
MKLPLVIHFVGLAPSPALEATIHARIAHIERLCPDVIAWRVTVTQEAQRQQQGRPFAVRVDVTLPRQELVVTRIHDEDVQVALRDALDAARRKLEETVRRRSEAARAGAAGPAP